MSPKFAPCMIEYVWKQSEILGLLVSKDGLILEINGYTEQKLHPEVIGKNINQVFLFLPEGWHPELCLHRDNAELYAVATGNGHPENFLFLTFYADDTFLFLGQPPFEDTATNTTLLSSLTTDLTHISRQLEKKNAELKNANQVKNEFLGVIALDIRSAVSTISDAATMMADAGDAFTAEIQKALLDSIRDQSNFMRNLVTQLLDFRSIETGIISLHLESFNPLEIVNTTILYYQLMAKKKAINLHSNFPQDACSIAVADKQKFQQVLHHLCSNAIKFSFTGSSITFRSWWEEASFFVAIEDNGTGIAPGTLRSIFTPLRSSSTLGTTGERGTGLGLPISQKIMKAHGGKIRVKSELGKGSTFLVELPLKAHSQQ